MKIISKKEFIENEEFYLKEALKGKIFVHPTDTIYGIGCDFTNINSVERIRKIKKRDSKPFSVIVPGKGWVKENCIINKKEEKWINKLPGPYTLILKLKKEGTLGVRIPDCWIKDFVLKLGRSFVSTSVNLTGEPPITCLEDLNEGMKEQIDYFVDEGKINGKPSTIVNLIDGEKVIER